MASKTEADKLYFFDISERSQKVGRPGLGGLGDPQSVFNRLIQKLNEWVNVEKTPGKAAE